jgi:hypothetical protein
MRSPRGALAIAFALAGCSGGGTFIPRGDGSVDLARPGDGRMNNGPDFSGGDQSMGAHKRVFITADSMFGNFGGTFVADDACNSAASAAGLGGIWIAWLSDAAGLTDAKSRMSDVSPWYLVNGSLAFDSTARFSGGPASPINVDQRGASQLAALVWTGTNATGAASGSDCVSWSSGTGNSATVGSGDALTEAWTQSQIIDCGGSAHLYCFEQ